MKRRRPAALALLALLATVPAHADERSDEIAELRRQIALLTRRIDQLEHQQAPRPEEATPRRNVTAAETPAAPSLERRVADLERTVDGNSNVLAKAEWIDRIKIKGDVRYRFEHIDAEHQTVKNRQRIRARLGVFADVNDWVTAGFAVRTGDKANSGNVTIGEHWDGFKLSVSQAYVGLAPLEEKYGNLTLGKFKQPWKNLSTLLWDGDLNPEGIVYGYNAKAKKDGLFATAGGYRVAEDSGSAHDLSLAGAQAGYRLPLGEKSQLLAGGSFYYYGDATDFYDPAYKQSYAEDFRVGQAFAELSFKDVGPVNVAFFGDAAENFAADANAGAYLAGIKISGDKWSVKYDYRVLGLNAIPAYFSDSDFAEGGTGTSGHYLKAKYDLAKHLSAGISYIAAKRDDDRTGGNGDLEVNTLLLDLMAGF